MQCAPSGHLRRGQLGQGGADMESVGWIGRAFTSRLMEIYEARFIAAPYTMKDSYYEYDGKLLHAGMLNQGYESYLLN